MLGTILINVLILLLIGALPRVGAYSSGLSGAPLASSQRCKIELEAPYK
ncbi:DUF3309 family protein [Methylobacterium oryzisoli]